MFCEKCGAQIPDGSKFCERCGAKIEYKQAGRGPQPYPGTPVQGRPVQGRPVQGMPGQGPMKINGLPKKTKMLIAGISSAAVLLIIIISVVAMSMRGKVDLNKYVIINTSGYDSVGRATYEFDTDAFRRDYGRKIKLKKSGNKFVDELRSSANAAELMLDQCVGGSLDETRDLSNGDTITFKWDCNDADAKRYFGAKLKYSDIKHEVKGLKKVDVFDPFESIELEYSGIAPSGKVRVRNNASSGPASELYFDVSPSENLSNGMTVEVSIDEDVDYLVEDYGAVPSAFTKEYTVDGLAAFATKIAEIPEDTLDKLKTQSEDVIKAFVARKWEEGITLNSATYLGSYFLSPKDPDTYNYSTQLYMIYKLQVHVYREITGLDDTFDFYSYVRFEDPMLLPDGTCSIDLSDYEMVSNQFTRKLEWNTGWSTTRTFYFNGYENLDSLFSNCVTSKIDKYTYDTTVKDKNTPSASAAPTAVAAETEAAQGASGEYILPNSSTQNVVKSDLENLTAEEVRLARNEIYARHGRKFQDAAIQSYFESKSWYEGTIEPDKFSDDSLNEVEKHNRDFITNYEKEKGYQ